ncbi:MAG: hypothetical protein KAW56_14450 [Candidatus Marinimicrobia bacterium]|nr:hypothetical protein [Candidatus Neomarinimicrobiota bacterium]
MYLDNVDKKLTSLLPTPIKSGEVWQVNKSGKDIRLLNAKNGTGCIANN